MYWIIVIVAVLVLTFLVWASADVGSNIYLKSVCKVKTRQNVVALTFDDGPDVLMTPRILDVLKEYNIKGTFFLIGRNVEECPELVRRIVAEGHTVANHTYSHLGYFPLSDACKVREEIQKCSEAIMSVVGVRPVLFRPPFGVTNPIIGKVVKRMRLQTIGWSIRSLDTIKNRRRDTVRKAVIKQLHNGAIILLHDRCQDADVLLRNLIISIRESGYSFTTVDQLINESAYEK